ncbi:2OG-Fe(II) oxygenase [Nocardioides litoris]|uniref:2OG-Fe(II) oxygenase n=1 Tax=Nocardioides litoris TaxID=1926648 RepID=UPI001B85E66A|nr:2OG-Fe(II) oxygenase [Nocardioides litoris]
MTTDQTTRPGTAGSVSAYRGLRDVDDLAPLLAHRGWVRKARPFSHVVARDVFVPDFYDALHRQVTGLIESETFRERNMGRYDASSSMVQQHPGGPLDVFLSRAWHDVMAGLWDVEATGDVIASLHHHAPGGRSGWPHNDLTTAWFPGADEPGRHEVGLSTTEVDAHTGERAEGVEARETVRGVAALFYLGNPEWSPGDGGETGLFESASGAHLGPAAAVPPINNSAVFFECTPFSWHAFLSNRTPRTSVVMWVHRRKQDVIERWGGENIVYWK